MKEVPASILLSFALVVAILFGGVAIANDENVAVVDLRAGRFKQLDARMSAVQSSYETGAITDEKLLEAFRVFYVTDPTLESRYALWIREMPKSYVARLARGIYYKYWAIDLRGEEFLANTTEAQLRRMKAKFELAMDDLKQSTTMTKKPLLSYQHALGIGVYIGDHRSNRMLLEAAVAIDPRTVIVRRRYLAGLQTRWGGGPDAMKEFVDECERAKVPARVLQEFRSEVFADKAWVAHRERRFSEAEALYEQQMKLSPDPEPVLKAIGKVQLDAREYSRARASFDAYLASQPLDAEAIAWRAYTHMGMHEPEATLKDFQRAAELGDAEAENQLAKMYWHGMGAPKDREAALRLFKAAADQGNVDAQHNYDDSLRQLNKK